MRGVLRAILPPPEDRDPRFQEEITRQCRAGLKVLGVVAAVLSIVPAIALALGLFLLPLPNIEYTRGALVATNFTVIATGVIFLLLSARPAAVRHARLIAGIAAPIVAGAIVRVELLAHMQAGPTMAPFFTLLAIVTLPYRPLEALAVGLAATAGYAISGLWFPLPEAAGVTQTLREVRVLGVVPMLAAFSFGSAMVAAILYAGRAETAIAKIERDALADKLAASERKHRLLFEQSSDSIFVLENASGRLVMANPAFETLLGVPAAELLEQPFSSFVHADDRKRLEEVVAARLRGEAVDSRLRVGLLKKGRDEPVIGDLTLHRAPEQHQTTGSIRDVTQQVMMEEEIRKKAEELEVAYDRLGKAQTKLVQSEKMASLGNLVAGVAHEINTPLGAIQSNTDVQKRGLAILKEGLADAELAAAFEKNKKLGKTFDMLEQTNSVTLEATQRIVRIVRSLRTFARLDEADVKEVDIHEGIESTLSLLHHETKNRIDVVKNYGALPRICCFPNQLNQVFMNLLQNSAQAIEGKGRITITTRVEGDHAVIEMSDTGKGIPAENLEKVFDPGFTTKGVGVGTGLGLSISYRIMQDHHGEIAVKSEPGKGATFTLRLPLDSSIKDEEKPASEEAPA